MRGPADSRADSDAKSSPDPYVSYIHRFFHRWLPVYDWFARSIFWVYGETVRRVGPGPGLKLLDICSGTGEIALRCARRGADVTGIDVTPEMLAKARGKAVRHRRTRAVRFETMDARDLAFPESSFDVAVIAFALHDMPRAVRIQVLAEAARVARGRLVILDYELPRSAPGRWVSTRIISLFETAYFRSFVQEGVAPLLLEAGLPPARVRRLFPPLFSILEIEL